MLFCSINSPLWRISSPKNGCQPDFYQEFDPYLGSLNVGEVMSQSTVQAKLCAGKNRIGSSIQAQSPGEVMGQRWRSYDLSDSGLHARIERLFFKMCYSKVSDHQAILLLIIEDILWF